MGNKKDKGATFDNIHKEVAKQKKNLPYTFIPISSKEKLETVSATKFNKSHGLLSGHIDCSMYALNFLFVGNKQTKNNEKTEKEYTDIHPLEFENKMLISPYTLKGCLSGFISNYLQTPLLRINDLNFLMRPNIFIYNDLDKNKQNKRYIVGYGIIDQIKENGLEIINISGQPQFKHKENDSISSVNDYENDYFEEHKGYYYFPYPDGWDGLGITVSKFLDQCEENREKTETKHHDCIGFKKRDFNNARNNEPIFIEINLIEDYKRTLEIMQSTHIKNHPFHFDESEKSDIVASLEEKKNLNVGDVIVFEYDVEENRITMFGRNFYYLWAYRYSLKNDFSDVIGYSDQEFLVEEDKIKISKLSELFGYSVDESQIQSEYEKTRKKFSSKSGKLHFNFGTYINGGKSVEKLHLKRPGDPKASAYEFYLKQDPNKEKTKPLNTWGDPARKDFDQKPELSGRKTYRASLQPNFPKVGNKDDEKMSVILHNALTPNGNIQSLEDFPYFKVKLNFENLSKKELDLICFALQLENNKKDNLVQEYNSGSYLCHQIGYGKNFGAGAVKFFIDNIVAYDENLELYSYNSNDAFNSYNLADKVELHESLQLRLNATSYPLYDGDIKTWHSEIRGDDFENRRGNSSKKLQLNSKPLKYEDRNLKKKKTYKKEVYKKKYESDEEYKNDIADLQNLLN